MIMAKTKKRQLYVADRAAETFGGVNGQSSIKIEAPIDHPPPDSNSDPIHLDLRLTRAQSAALRKLRLGLKRQRATCHTVTGERLVDSKADAIRWLLEACYASA